ncbi:MAG: hypothetical protein A2W91_03765 [Bacteroidetes bacterium GWF2_38_335]|nr:MAG: hypothetical protein A2W91_03765 [Bacteroidetes bacterium GWF2_38_335]OFY77400.1 MAG: hypothetical protein A2281_00995 [Bacteroidetes bacterium RIFOXYA12_FULL_38_20]HBS87313.1 hypothetical protein [Bacteroidales bacterium]
MKTHYRILGYILGTLGIFLGFSNKIAAQYGVYFERNYFISGQIKTEECLETVPNATVLLNTPQVKTIRETKSDENGIFIMEIDGNHGSYSVSVIDSSGKLLQNEVPLEINYDSWYGTPSEGYYIASYLREPLLIFLKHKNTPPCEVVSEPEISLPVDLPILFENGLFIENAEISEDPNAVVPEDFIEEDQVLKFENTTEETSGNIIIYPNPADNRFTLELINVNIADKLIEIYDAHGKMVYREKSMDVTEENKIEITLNCVPGTYLVVIKGKNEVYSEKIVIY